MAQIINTNIPSLNAQRNLAVSQKGLATTLERLSTGLRINSAKDDAAGLAISERFTSQIKGLNQAVRNANDGISLSQTAESALSTVGDNLQRIRELAVQAANATNSAGDRKALDQEVQQRIAEISRVALNSEFNGESILDGSKGESFFQIGPNQGQMITITNMDSRTSKLGNQEVFSPINENTSPVTHYRLTQTEATELSENQDIYIGTIEITGLSGSLLNKFKNPAVAPDPGPIQVTAPQITLSDGSTVNGFKSLEEAVSEINKKIREVIDVGDEAGQELAEANLRAFLRTDNSGRTGIVVTGDFDKDGASRFAISGGGITDTVDNKITPTSLFMPAWNSVIGGETVTYAAQNSLDALNVLTPESSSQAMGIIDGALNHVNSLRSEMGAVQSRFESTIENLRVGSESMSAARSRIRDADFAAETAELTRVQILQQSGISVLTQANALPQQALQLLGG